jgi:hypothetical protein
MSKKPECWIASQPVVQRPHEVIVSGAIFWKRWMGGMVDKPRVKGFVPAAPDRPIFKRELKDLRFNGAQFEAILVRIPIRRVEVDRPVDVWLSQVVRDAYSRTIVVIRYGVNSLERLGHLIVGLTPSNALRFCCRGVRRSRASPSRIYSRGCAAPTPRSAASAG